MTDRYTTVIDELDHVWARIEMDAEERLDMLKRIELLEQK